MKERPEHVRGADKVQDERRSFARFEVPGASLSYRAGGFLRKGPAEEFCPVENLSLGGLKMLCRLPLRPGRRLALRMSFADDDLILEWSGRVAWIFPVRDADFAFSMGVHFDPLEGRRNPKAVAVLAALKSLEKKYERRRP